MVPSSSMALMAMGTENVPGRKGKGTLDAELEVRWHAEMSFNYSSSDLGSVMTLVNMPSLWVQGSPRAVITVIHLPVALALSLVHNICQIYAH